MNKSDSKAIKESPSRLVLIGICGCVISRSNVALGYTCVALALCRSRKFVENKVWCKKSTHEKICFY